MKKLIYFIGVFLSLSILFFACEKQSNQVEPETVIDDLKGKKTGKIMICHLKGNGDYNIIEVNKNAWPAHEAHGDGIVFGKGTFSFEYLLGSSTYPHIMYVTKYSKGSFEGNGYYEDNTGYTWDVTGTIDDSGNTSYTVVYTGINAGYYADVVGSFDCDDNEFSGTFEDSNGAQGSFTGGYFGPLP